MIMICTLHWYELLDSLIPPNPAGSSKCTNLLADHTPTHCSRPMRVKVQDCMFEATQLEHTNLQ